MNPFYVAKIGAKNKEKIKATVSYFYQIVNNGIILNAANDNFFGFKMNSILSIISDSLKLIS